VGLSVIIITKNEAEDLPRALDSVAFADEVIVLDSGSTDGTQEVARTRGARVFETDDWPGFGPQKNRALGRATQDWVLSLDADEWLEPELANEIQELVSGPQNSKYGQISSPAAYRIRRRSIYIDRMIRYGDWRRDAVVRLFQRNRASFSPDLVHERLVVDGAVGSLRGRMGHHSARSIQDSREKMLSYNHAAAQKIAQEGRGSSLRGILSAVFSLFRGLILRMGLLDGVRGIQLAWFNACGAYLKYSVAESIQDERSYKLNAQSLFQRINDWLHFLLVDHGILRAIYSNQFLIQGALYRSNQPSPRRLRSYKKKYGIRSVINLRGKNEQLSWYRLEERACKKMGLTLINTQVYSRGLVDSRALEDLKKLIEQVELPALVHCKSGADRAGFFSVLFRHYRLGEPIEEAISELGIKYGHFSSAKTGVLDYFYRKYLNSRGTRQSFVCWCRDGFDRIEVQMEFNSDTTTNWVVNNILRRE
jgi:glycosyltransferase involved in cell wall biosynthesis